MSSAAETASRLTRSMNDVSIGIVGLGYWGPNLARNFAALPGARLAWLCDGRPEMLERHGINHPQARTTTDFADLLNDPGLDAVVLATPVPTHAELAIQV